MEYSQIYTATYDSRNKRQTTAGDRDEPTYATTNQRVLTWYTRFTIDTSGFYNSETSIHRHVGLVFSGLRYHLCHHRVLFYQHTVRLTTRGGFKKRLLTGGLGPRGCVGSGISTPSSSSPLGKKIKTKNDLLSSVVSLEHVLGIPTDIATHSPIRFRLRFSRTSSLRW